MDKQPVLISRIYKAVVRPTDRRLWTLAWPLMLTNLTVPLLGLVDMLEDLDDVQQVHTNAEIPDEVLAEL